MSAGYTPLQIQAEAQRRKRERAAQQAREQARAAQQALLRERSWRDWSAALWPDRQYAPRHEALWAWFEALRFGYKPPARIEDWPRGGGKSSSVEGGAAYAGITGRRRFVMYVSGTQAKADVHVQAIGTMLESCGVMRSLNKYGNSKGWTQQLLRAANDFNVISFGLDAGARGIKLDEFRPDLIVLDDVDDRHDTLATVQKKIETITQSILPSGSADYAVLFVQNTIHADSVMAQLLDGRAAFLLDRAPPTIEPAVRDLIYSEQRDSTGQLRYVITAGTPTWVGQNLDVCQSQINNWGLTAFLREAQHDVDEVIGSIFSHLDFAAITLDRDAMPAVRTVIVWCDPAVSNTDQSDHNGVQVDALGVDGVIYRLFSWEQRATPVETLKLALLKAVEYGAHTVGVETDQGGDTWRSVVDQAWQALITSGAVPPTTCQPRFVSAKAGSVGSKAERGSRMLTAYERHAIRHVRGTHTVLERALHRFLIKKPFDLVDAAFWAWHDLNEQLTHPSPTAAPIGMAGISKWKRT